MTLMTLITASSLTAFVVLRIRDTWQRRLDERRWVQFVTISRSDF